MPKFTLKKRNIDLLLATLDGKSVTEAGPSGNELRTVYLDGKVSIVPEKFLINGQEGPWVV